MDDVGMFDSETGDVERRKKLRRAIEVFADDFDQHAELHASAIIRDASAICARVLRAALAAEDARVAKPAEREHDSRCILDTDHKGDCKWSGMNAKPPVAQGAKCHDDCLPEAGR